MEFGIEKDHKHIYTNIGRKFTITNMATMGTFEGLSDTFIVGIIGSCVISPSQK